MTTYRVQRMTKEDYNKYMGGGFNYNVETVYIEANTKTEAILKAQRPSYWVNENYVFTLEEYETALETARKEREEAERKEAEKKAKKAEAEARKAAEAHMTVTEWKAEKNRKARLNRTKRDLEAARAEVARLEALVKRLGGEA